uniref:Immunoglobulin domain-containing protein n=1 Tax=Chrysemys picta bellii TaxID=8478 RepID=A0A8C3P656_CHRPI
MASALTALLLGEYQRQPGLVPMGDYPKPPIWVSPSRVVALGGSVTICCESWYPGMKFFLRKAEHPNRQVRTVPDGTVAEFPIPSVGWEDGGSYTCEYHSITDQSRWSHPSDPIKIIVVGEGPGSVGSYSCYYHSRSEPFAVSYPSDPVELVVRGERLPLPAPVLLQGTRVGVLGLVLCCSPGGRDSRAPGYGPPRPSG